MIKKNIFKYTVAGSKNLSEVALLMEQYGIFGKTNAQTFLVVFTPRLSHRTLNDKPYVGYVNCRVNTTLLFLEADGSKSNGVSNLVSPIPEVGVTPMKQESDYYYILPGQHYEFIFTLDKDSHIGYDDSVTIMVPYISFTKDDAEIADSLVEDNLLEYIKRRIGYRPEVSL